MLNQMNKHINHLSWDKLMGIEKKEHNLKSVPTMSQYLQMEKREHNLKGTPSVRRVLQAESVEHSSESGDVVIRPSKAQEKKASAIYRKGM